MEIGLARSRPCSTRQRGRLVPVEYDTQRVKIAAGVDRAVHSSRLLGRHGGQRAGSRLRRSGGVLTRHAAGNAEPGKPDLPTHMIHRDIARFYILVDQAASMDLGERLGDADSERQEPPYRHWRPEEQIERLAPGILEHQHGSSRARGSDWSGCTAQPRFSSGLRSDSFLKAIENVGCWRLRDRRDGQHGGLLAVSVWPQSSGRSPYLAAGQFRRRGRRAVQTQSNVINSPKRCLFATYFFLIIILLAVAFAGDRARPRSDLVDLGMADLLGDGPGSWRDDRQPTVPRGVERSLHGASVAFAARSFLMGVMPIRTVAVRMLQPYQRLLAFTGASINEKIKVHYFSRRCRAGSGAGTGGIRLRRWRRPRRWFRRPFRRCGTLRRSRRWF